MNSVETRFLALEPDELFARQVLMYKGRVRNAVGEQLYLGDPPHLTLYAAVFPTESDVTGPIGIVCRHLAAPAVTIRGWHVFEADQLTGNHTLVCDVTPDTRATLRQVQQQSVAAVAPFRDRQTTRACYDKSWHRLSAEERANVEGFGFPFVGPVWHPHVTVASVRPEDWQAAWSELAGTPPEAEVRFPSLSIHRLEAGRAFLVQRFVLEDVE